MDSSIMVVIMVLALLLSASALVVCIFAVRSASKAKLLVPDEILRHIASKDDIRMLHEDNERARTATERQAKEGREESSKYLNAVKESINSSFMAFNKSQVEQWNAMGQLLNSLKDATSNNFFAFNEAQAKQWDVIGQRMDALRDAITKSFTEFNESQAKQWDTIGQRIENMSTQNVQKLDGVRETVDKQLRTLQTNNEKKLDEMRGVVDEKLTKTLDTRLGESFKQVSEQLEAVYKSLGEVKNLSKDMGDIKNIFKNVKTRGTWGEVQLASLLEQMLTPEQYATNIKLRKGSDDNVEFAIKLPGPDDSPSSVVWLPIDSKFPMEDYERMMDAVEKSDADAMHAASKALEARVVGQARSIRDKYINPPTTTDFAILFVPVESLFAEILRRPGLSERLQKEFHVTVTGPTTLAALLNSLRMGFHTLAIQKSSSEVWKLLGAVKKQFGSFADNLTSIEKHLERATKSVQDASNRTDQIQKKLDKVQVLDIHEAEPLLTSGIIGVGSAGAEDGLSEEDDGEEELEGTGEPA